MSESVFVPLETIEWERWGDVDGGEPENRLLATVAIGGVPHHLEAIEVRESEDGVQEAVAGGEQFDELYVACGGDGPLATVEIDGRGYCLFLSPFCY